MPVERTTRWRQAEHVVGGQLAVRDGGRAARARRPPTGAARCPRPRAAGSSKSRDSTGVNATLRASRLNAARRHVGPVLGRPAVEGEVAPAVAPGDEPAARSAPWPPARRELLPVGAADRDGLDAEVLEARPGPVRCVFAHPVEVRARCPDRRVSSSTLQDRERQRHAGPRSRGGRSSSRDRLAPGVEQRPSSSGGRRRDSPRLRHPRRTSPSPSTRRSAAARAARTGAAARRPPERRRRG